MYWLDKIVSSNLDFSTNYNEILSHFSLKNSFIYELFRVMFSQNNFFSYYFQALFILLLGILYSLSHFLFQDLVTFYNFYSILFSTLNILLCYKILEIIKKLEDNKIFVKSMFMIGNPEDDETKVLETIDYSKKLKNTLVQFSVFTPYPGTPAFKILNQ
jgi:hypothetical protein